MLSHNLKPILCIGETWQEKDFDISIEILNKQLIIALHNLSPQQTCELLIAYEPVWAIGDSGIPAKPQYIEYVLSNIQNTLCE